MRNINLLALLLLTVLFASVNAFASEEPVGDAKIVKRTFNVDFAACSKNYKIVDGVIAECLVETSEFKPYELTIRNSKFPEDWSNPPCKVTYESPTGGGKVYYSGGAVANGYEITVTNHSYFNQDKNLENIQKVLKECNVSTLESYVITKQ